MTPDGMMRHPLCQLFDTSAPKISLDNKKSVLYFQFSLCLLIFTVFCSSGLQSNTPAVKDDILNIDTNRRISKTPDRVASSSPLIIRLVAGSAPGDKKSRLDQKLVAAASGEVDGAPTAFERDGSVDIRSSQDQGPRTSVDNKNMEKRTAADAEVVGSRKVETMDGTKFGDFVTTDADAISYGHTATNAADRALCVAPFTHASHGVSLMCSEVAGGGADSDEEMGDAGQLLAGGLAVQTKSPLGSSSSTQPSSRRSVQHMLKQIHDAGERINERLGARDFGARRRLPAVPADTVHDSDMLTSSQSAKSDGSGEAHLDHRPVRSVLEELPRLAIRSPRSLGKNSATPSGISRQLPDASAVKHSAKTDEQPISAKPENLLLTDCPPSDEMCIKFSRQLQDLSSAVCSMQVDNQLNPTHLVYNDDVPADGKQPAQLSDDRSNDVVNKECRPLPAPTTEPFILLDKQVSTVPPICVTGDIQTHLAEKKPESLQQLGKLADSAAVAKSEKFPDPSAAKCCEPLDSQLIHMQLACDPQIPEQSFQLMALESRPAENLKCLDSLHDSIPFSNFTGRGVADGESPRNTISDEVDGKMALGEHPQSPITKLSGVDNLLLCHLCSETDDCRCEVVERENNAVNSTSAECFQTGSNSWKIKTVSKCSSDLVSPECLALSNAVVSGIDFITGNESRHYLKAAADHVCVDADVKLQTHSSQASATSGDIAEMLWSGNGNEGPRATVNHEQSVPNTSSRETKNISLASCELTDASLVSNNNSNERLQSLVSFIWCDEKKIHKDAVTENAAEMMHNSSSADKLRSDDNELHSETGTSETSALRTSSPNAIDELSKPKTKSSKCVYASPNSGGHVVRANEPFCLVGPRRALSTQNTFVSASTSSAVLETSGQTPAAVCFAGNFTGNVPVKNDQLLSAHVPIIRGKNAANATAVSSATKKPVAVNQRKPGSVAVNVACSGLSGTIHLSSRVRLSAHSPQPPTKPASIPAVAATQARLRTFLAY